MGKQGSRFRLSQLIIYLFLRHRRFPSTTTIRKLFILLVVVEAVETVEKV